MLSEVFLLATSIPSIKRPFHLSLPYYEENHELCDTVVLTRGMDMESEWSTLPHHASVSIAWHCFKPHVYTLSHGRIF